jgi:hypothetical protein
MQLEQMCSLRQDSKLSQIYQRRYYIHSRCPPHSTGEHCCYQSQRRYTSRWDSGDQRRYHVYSKYPPTSTSKHYCYQRCPKSAAAPLCSGYRRQTSLPSSMISRRQEGTEQWFLDPPKFKR